MYNYDNCTIIKFTLCISVSDFFKTSYLIFYVRYSASNRMIRSQKTLPKQGSYIASVYKLREFSRDEQHADGSNHHHGSVGKLRQFILLFWYRLIAVQAAINSRLYRCFKIVERV